MKRILLHFTLLFWGIDSHAQITLKADGKTDTF